MRTDKYQIREHPQNKRVGNMLDDLDDVHNHFLAVEKRYYRMYGKYAGRYRLQPHLTKLLQRTHKHWAWIPRDTLDQVIVRIHIGYERFVHRVGPPLIGLKTVVAVVAWVPRSSNARDGGVLRSSKQATRFLKNAKTENLL